MERFKTIKVPRKHTTTIYVEKKIPMWYYKFLFWLFRPAKESFEKYINEDKAEAWDKSFYHATNKAHSSKEEAMQKKLNELGYEVRCNFPMAQKLNESTTTSIGIDPAKAWDIVQVRKEQVAKADFLSHIDSVVKKYPGFTYSMIKELKDF